MQEPVIIKNLPVTVPDDRIFMRLGRYRHQAEISESQMQYFTGIIADGKRLCHLAGSWLIVPIFSNDGEVIVVDGGDEFRSQGLAKLLSGCPQMLLFAVTAGAEIVAAASDAAASGHGAEALLFDAPGGEAAEAGCGWLQDYVRQQLKRRGLLVAERRFSPGYGGLALDTQAIFYRRLHLKTLGLTLLDSGMMVPEKTVTAIAGISNA